MTLKNPDTCPTYAHEGVRPILKALVEVTENGDYLSWPKERFVGAVMQASRGVANPKSIRDHWYPMIMKDRYGENYEERVAMNIAETKRTYTFVVPDIHGRRDLLDAAIDEIEKTAHKGKVIFLGDYVDRGPDSKGVIDRLMEGPSDPEAWEWVFLKGNHEDMLLDCWDDVESDGQWWRTHGGDYTMASYDGTIPQEHLDWIAALDDLHSDDHRVYVHAAVSETASLSEQTEAMLRWYKYPQGADVGWNNHHIVHGHVASTGPELLTNRTNLDAGAYFTGAIYIAMFDDAVAGGPVRHGYVNRTGIKRATVPIF